MKYEANSAKCEMKFNGFIIQTSINVTRAKFKLTYSSRLAQHIPFNIILRKKKIKTITYSLVNANRGKQLQ